MALTNAERQARWRERQREKLAEAQAAASSSRYVTSAPGANVDRLKRRIEKLERDREDDNSRLLFAQDVARTAEEQRDKAQNEALFLRSDNDRLKVELAQAKQPATPLRDDPWTLIFEAYAGGAEQWKSMVYRRPGDAFVANALRVFRREKITQDDVLRILELTAFARMNDIYGHGRAVVDPDEPEWRTHRDAVAKLTGGKKNRAVT